MTGVVPNVTIVTPKIVALTNGQRLSSNLEEKCKFTGNSRVNKNKEGRIKHFPLL